jgi:hypothetical protein
MKTIDINAKEWFDKVNGNSYFSAVITLDYGTPEAKEYKLPFQYGYGEHYIDMANQFLMSENIIPFKRHENGSHEPLWQYCKDNNIILRTSKQENCKKREL